MDLTFGQLDGWWRFADDYRPHHALASPAVWRQALGNSGFGEVEVLGVDESDAAKMPDKGVIVARGPVEVAEPAGVWVLAASSGDRAAELAGLLAARNQTVVLAGSESPEDEQLATGSPGVFKAAVEMDQRESWQSLLESLPQEVPFNGVVHLAALDGRGTEAAVEEMAEDVKQIGASALALVQGLTDADVTPEKGVWFVTRGAQVLERERGGALAGATLWGFGKVVAQEAAHLQPKMVDLDPAETAFSADFLNELLYPDSENHIAYRLGDRLVARLVRFGTEAERLVLPEESDWVLSPDPGGIFEKPEVKLLPERILEPKEVRVTVEATGLNFWDVFRSLGFIEEGNLGRELCGHILDVGSDVSTVSVGDRVVGLGFGAFGPEMITREELVAPAPSGVSVSGLATVPSAFVSAALSYELSGLEAGDRVLIHAGAGGVGLAAIQLANVAGAEVFATASAPKQAYLRSLGVEHVFDSRQTAFGKEILEATDGAGVDVVLNCLTSEGFIDASLSCLAKGGRFVELARRDILSKDEMAAVRPDVAYDILELDVLKKTEPAWVGRVLDGVMEQFSAGETDTDRPQQVAASRSGSRIEVHALGAAPRKNRPDAASAHEGPIAAGPDLSGDWRIGWNRVCRGRMARGSGSGSHRAEWAPGPGCCGRGDDQRTQGTRDNGAGGTGGCVGRRCGGPDAGADRPGVAAPRRRDPQRGGAVGRCVDQPELGELREGAVAEDSGGLAPAPRDNESRPGSFRPLLESGRCDGQSRPGESRRGQCLSGPARWSPPCVRPPGTGHRLGGLVGNRRSGRATGTDRAAARGAWWPLVYSAAGNQST